MTVRIAGILLMLTCLGGCGGEYILTVGDVLGPCGGEAVVVSRLQRNDFFVLSLPMRDALVTFVIPGSKERGCYTDKLGYAGTTVPVPEVRGTYRLYVSHLDIEGEEVRTDVPVYVWSPEKQVVAIDVDALPDPECEQSQAARAALEELGGEVNLIYMTRKGVSKHNQVHEMLRKGGYPDGAVLVWRPRRSSLVSQLGELRKRFPELQVGVTDSSLGAKGFGDSQMRCVIVGNARTNLDNVTRISSWAELPRAVLQREL